MSKGGLLLSGRRGGRDRPHVLAGHALPPRPPRTPHPPFTRHSPALQELKVVERRPARRAKLYYLRGRNPKEFRA